MSNTFGPVTLLNGVTGTGAGPVIDLGAPYSTFSYFAWTASGSGSTTVDVEGSQDGSHWKSIIGGFSVGPGGTEMGRTAAQPRMRYVRGNVTVYSTAVTLTVVAE